ncbi:hypothetical protein N7472_001574 [Penicillium cf. griseofulvum]|uniref:O-methyltransferase C-terminal domain-containing protein n=1 Tax=Penicillium cf. griseofulvum TaxID=2972120 RepID=A0A9W9MPI3_9EURO|nr:hypothetical protein N7472_001574 [Penicillium cf. griseofulvum]
MDEGLYPLENDVFLVDVGRNRGHDLLEFQSNWPTDLPSVLGGIEFPEGSIEIVPHDFFLEQPIKGARAYYLRSILHNWNDQNCREILSQISEVLDPNYSRLLIHENVLPSIRAHWGVTAMDIMMMANVGAEERTELQWCQLIERAGLKVSKSWTVSSAESLVECTLLGEGPRT